MLRLVQVIIPWFAVVIAVTSALVFKHRTARIYNGEATNILKIPYQVSIESPTRYRLGGCLISEKFVLTAASALENNDTSELIVRTGSSFYGEGGTVHRAKRIIIHEDHSPLGSPKFPGFMVNDIAIIEFDNPILNESSAKPIEMFRAGEKIRPNATGIVSGWGLTETRSLFRQVRSVIVPVINRSECIEKYPSLKESLAEGQICAGAVETKVVKDSGDGDIGNPLVVDGRLAGIVSWGTPFWEVPDSPSAYTEVAHYRDWIKKHTGL